MTYPQDSVDCFAAFKDLQKTQQKPVDYFGVLHVETDQLQFRNSVDHPLAAVDISDGISALAA